MLNEIYRGSTVPESCLIDNPTTSWLDGIIIWILQKLLVVVVPIWEVRSTTYLLKLENPTSLEANIRN